MTHNDKIKMVAMMKRFGGSFVRALAECFILADSNNLDRLYKAFPEIVQQYNPLDLSQPTPITYSASEIVDNADRQAESKYSHSDGAHG